MVASLLNCAFNIAFAQDETSSSGGTTDTPSTETQLGELLDRLSILPSKFKDERKRRLLVRRIKSINRKIVRAVNSVPPEKCLEKLKVAMDDFYALVSQLGQGIACGPPIIPPYLRTVDKTQVTPDCIQPDQLSQAFSESFGVYEKARSLFHIDINSNQIPDVCESVNGN